MKEKDKNRKPDLSDFINYHKRDMTYLQRNAFEKKLQKDPFAEEAEEGFSEISPEEVKSDLILLEKKLKVRSSRGSRVIYYRIAASIAVIMVISSVFILTERNRPKERKAEIALNQIPLEIPESKAIILPEVLPSENLQLPERTTEKQKASLDKKVRSVASQQSDELVPVSGIATENSAGVSESKDDVNPVTDSIRIEPKKFLAAAEAEVREKDDLAAPALNEVMVTGYGVSKSSKTAAATAEVVTKAENEKVGYTPPSPENGKDNFDKYIEENIRKPASLIEGERAVVVMSFSVMSSGVIQNIKIIKSQGQEFSDEAVRLIKEGPRWKPAEDNGEKINDEVRMRIIFR
ncbi:MAG: energy transducer TonB [Bacteroidales bacterium]|jgi:TonB family protein|nr:energy transducer TonB [Bacteroidales bacterium]